jgi:hypothetical protein
MSRAPLTDLRPDDPDWVLAHTANTKAGSVTLGPDFEYRIGGGLGQACTTAVYWLADHEPPLVTLNPHGPVEVTNTGRRRLADIRKAKREAAREAVPVPAVTFQPAAA